MDASAPHPTDRDLRAYGLGQLDDLAAESVHSHLEGCPGCRRRVAEVSSDSFLGRLRDARAGSQFSRPAVSSTDGLSLLGAAPVAAPPPPAGTLPPGLADHPGYEILQELGRGGMGVVYLTRNKLMGRLEVLKVVGSHLASKPAIRERFLREIRSAAQLHHPNIVTAYTAMELGESLVLAMEYVEGSDLARRVKEKGPLAVASACYLVYQAALGLQHAHEHGMVHRDIKPANLILAIAGKKAVVKVLDFGLAKVTSEGGNDRGLTREGQMLGTPDYIAPEQIREAQSADVRADIYSLGCTLYYLLAGKPPFDGASLWDLYQAHFSMDASPLNLVRPEVPTELAALVAKMMAKVPARRFQEPNEVAQALIPFFKKGDVAVGTSRTEASRVGQAPTERVTPQTRAGASTVRPAPDRPPVIPPPIPGPADRARAVPQWESLINLEGAERSTKSAADAMVPPRRRPPWKLPAIVAAAVLGALTLGVIVIRILDEKGREINKYIVPPGSQVLIEQSPNKDELKLSEKGRDDEAVSLPGSKPTATPTDPLKAQSFWRGTSMVLDKPIPDAYRPLRSLWLTIKERDGTRFKAVAESVSGLHDVEGTFTNGVINWRVAKLNSSWEGKLDGNQIVGTYTSTNWQGVYSGTFRLTLADGPPPRERPGRVPPVGPMRETRHVRGFWSVEGGQLIKAGLGDGWVQFGFLEWTDYDLTFRALKSAGPHGIGCGFRQSEGKVYWLGLGGPDGKHSISHWNGLTKEATWPHQIAGTIQTDEWYAVKIMLRGRHIRVELDDEVLFDCDDDFNPRGMVSLRFFDSAGRFKDIRVTAPDGTVLWEGPPDLP